MSRHQYVWSAAPTPFLSDFSIDHRSVERMVQHHVALGVDGIMLAGTCGEGPWMTVSDLAELVSRAKQSQAGEIALTAHVTDNSPRRVLERIEAAAKAGAEAVVLSTPYFWFPATASTVTRFFVEVIERSPLPVGVYDRGSAAACSLAESLEEILEHPRVTFCKDSAAFDAVRSARLTEIKQRKPEFLIFCGDEFKCIPSLETGYDGLLLGGAVFNARLARLIVGEVRRGNLKAAQAHQEKMNALMYRVYGGERFVCWLGGLKYLLQQLGIFSTTVSHLPFSLTDECRAGIDEMVCGDDQAGYRVEISSDFCENLAAIR